MPDHYDFDPQISNIFLKMYQIFFDVCFRVDRFRYLLVLSFVYFVYLHGNYISLFICFLVKYLFYRIVVSVKG